MINLRNIRKQAGLTQDQLAEKAGVSRSQIAKWENETQSPSLQWIKKLASTMGVSATSMISEDEMAQPTSKANKIAADISIACVTAINALVSSKKLPADMANTAIEKAIRYFWDDFVAGAPPSQPQIKKYMLSLIE